ncbi:MAG: formimidoylglutamate deiminase [Paracoccaceae bacterium]|nr:formimidoylglutamate deiminase [Paracoccaceae bacterium]
MQIIWAEQALTRSGWQRNLRIEIANDGQITSLTPDSPPQGTRLRVALPAPANLHSHAFQRAMAGLAEQRSPRGQDSFWSWRALMYRFLGRLDPDDVEAITAYAQLEMLKTGFAAVGEFHYLHHAPGGQHYDNPAEMAGRVMDASRQTGIGLCLLPVLYMQGGCDGREPSPEQRRFLCDFNDYSRILSATGKDSAEMPDDFSIGVAPHSLRAVTSCILDKIPSLSAGRPVHIHIAEQLAEVSEVSAALGARPVQWLLENQPVDETWCLVHATHMTGAETRALAASGAVAGLCPITEANLGDGIFPAHPFLAAGGRFGLGSDSNIQIDLAGEMRMLEYSQRLGRQERNVIARQGSSCGATLLASACRGGAQALGRNSGAIAVGKLADIVEIDLQHPDFEGLEGDRLIDSWIFARTCTGVRNLWSGGRHVIMDGRHAHEADIANKAGRVFRRMRSAL